MSFNENWPRWIIASINKSFEANRGAYPLYVEGEERRTSKLESYLELRIDGPDIDQSTKDDYRLEVVVNMLCVCYVNKDLYLLERMIGMASKAFLSQLPVYQYNDNPAIQIGCLQLISQQLTVHRYGQVKPDVKALEATVEGRYAIDF